MESINWAREESIEANPDQSKDGYHKPESKGS